MSDIRTLSPDELDAVAKSLAGKHNRERHWSRLAAILGRIEREKLSSHYGYGTTLAYAREELDMDAAEYFALLGLWKMVDWARPSVPLEAWLTIPRTYAIQLKRVLGPGKPGANPEQWFEWAMASKNAEDLKRRINGAIGVETFITLKVAVPVTMEEMWHDALVLALEEATGDAHALPELAEQRSTKFRCLEVVLRWFLHTYRGAGSAPALLSQLSDLLTTLTARPDVTVDEITSTVTRALRESVIQATPTADLRRAQ